MKNNNLSIEYNVNVKVFCVPYIKSKGKGRVLVEIGGESCTVEKAVSIIFENLGFESLKGEDIHLASHVLSGNFMGLKDSITFINWATYHGESKRGIDNLLNEGQKLLEKFNSGESDLLPSLLDNLEKKWECYYKPAEEKKRTIKIFTKFLLSNPHLAKSWIDWYSSISYDPGGAPDLFLINPSENNWLWAEVKSLGDSLHKGQWAWLEGFIMNVAKNVSVIRIIPSI